MAELLFRVSSSAFGTQDLIANFDGHTTIGQLADTIESVGDRSGGRARTIRRLSRGQREFAREEKIVHCDLRSGDEIELGIDSGVRSSSDNETFAKLTVVAGTDENRVFELQRGEAWVGRSDSNEICLMDDLVSRRHAVFRVSDGVEVADAGSTNGVTVNGEVISGVRRLRDQDVVGIGADEMVVEIIGAQNSTVVLSNNTVEFTRPPRVEKPFEGLKVSLPAPAVEPRRIRFSILTALAPMLMGIGIYFMTKSLYSVMFMALSPIMLIANYFESRSTAAQEYREAVAEFEATLHDCREELADGRKEEIASAFRFSPSPAELFEAISGLTSRLWEREHEHSDFLNLRVGLLEQDSSIVVEVPNSGKRDERIKIQEIADEYKSLPAVPVTFSASEGAPVGVAGPIGVARSVARSLLMQCAVLHSPSELAIGALVADENEAEWDWLKWLPHSRAFSRLETKNPLCVAGDGGAEWVAHFSSLISERLPAEHGDIGAADHIVLLIEEACAIDRSRLAGLLEHAHHAKITIIWLADDDRKVPNACKTLLKVEPGGEALTLSDAFTGKRLGGIPIEPISLEDADYHARLLAPIDDVWSVQQSDASLPKSVSLFDLIGGLGIIEDPGVLLQRWDASSKSKGLVSHVGQHSEGVFGIDIRTDGPHGLVGGTTGSGKSELLQSMLASFALNYPPSKLTFLLVDYKGGSAFGDLAERETEPGEEPWDGLIHTVGMITDLNPALVQRALTSLHAEIHRREIILANHRAKDLIELEERGVADAPPNLLIVVDEFAALKSEVPEFFEGVVDIAQRGRSLGMHLILATQKPSGEISGSLAANTNLRIALRVATEDDSKEIVDSPVAGRFDRGTPGRAVARMGATDLTMFQSAYVGGHTVPDEQAVLEIGELKFPGTHWVGVERVSEVPQDAESDLRRIVRAANCAAHTAGISKPRKPWIPALPAQIDLFRLPPPDSAAAVPFGIIDLPAEQKRALASFDCEKHGNLIIAGMGGSGKTVLLRTFACSFARSLDKQPPNIYCVDYASRGLDLIADLPNVGEVVRFGDIEGVSTLLEMLASEFEYRSALFSRNGVSSLNEYLAVPEAEALRRIVILWDGFGNTQQEVLFKNPKLDGIVTRLIGGARAVGIHFILTGTAPTDFTPSILASVDQCFVLRLAEEDHYARFGADANDFDDSFPAGRMLWRRNQVQAGIAGGEPATSNEVKMITALAAQMRAAGIEEVAALPRLLEVMSARDFSSEPGAWLVDENINARTFDTNRHCLVFGRSGSGRTTAMRAAMAAYSELTGKEPVVFTNNFSEFPKALPFEKLEEVLGSNSPPDQIFVDNADHSIPSGSGLDQWPQDRQPLIASLLADETKCFVTMNSADTSNWLIAPLLSRGDVCVLQPKQSDGGYLGLESALVVKDLKWPVGRGYFRIGSAPPTYGHILLS